MGSLALNDQNPLEEIRRRIKAGETSWAIGQLRSMISQGVAGPDVHRLLALAHLEDGGFERAIQALEAARSINPNAGTEVAFGRFLNTEGHKQAALNCFL